MTILGLYNNLNTFLVIGAMLFAMGIYGVVTRRTFIGMLIAAEMILAGASVNFMAFNRFVAPDPVTGQVFTLFIMAVAAAEAAIGLSIVVAVYRHYYSIDAEDATQLKG
ncbi:NADH-quinone oxidoreductase subunit NuoK [Desulforhopalus singaporensis]|uniref:NADH-quinone oxidoreductase subunit K n=1 Tax=Desulforhopalus singaporensis TaxID=91360 RepID=A0A1H0V592_9BACT|nr:NADH-quinone oxidoreductase subunit NuoK [Desulforhopalus singaporensis]SDP73465.1 NADH dehydrogenase subunit K [Desulforhopalus singaporensis]